MIVDAHVHLLPERLTGAIRRFFAAHIPGSLRYPGEHGPARQAIVAAGVGRCWSLPYAHRAGVAAGLNRWMAEAFAGDPVVVPGATLHPEDDVDAVLDEAFGGLGLRVLKLHCSVGAFAPDDPRLDPLWRRVSAGRQAVVLHVGRAVDGRTAPFELAAVGRVAERWPEAPVIIAHAGAPAVGATLDLLRRTRSIYADLTPVVTELVPLERAAVAGLERRLLFGSDAPNVAVPIEGGLAHVRGLGLAPGDEAAILGGNAERLLAG